jgi:hypothetical protein
MRRRELSGEDKPMFTVDIDTGGTMTDALVSNGSEIRAFKVDTTPHDYTVSFRECLAEAARQFGYKGVPAFLDDVKLIRWSSTITSNVIGERRGAKVGLLVSRGHEQDLYGSGRSPIVDELVEEHNVIGLPDNPTAQDVLGASRERFRTTGRSCRSRASSNGNIPITTSAPSRCCSAAKWLRSPTTPRARITP